MLYEKIRQLLADQLEIDPETITPDTNVVEDLGADSLDMMELVTSIEEEYGIVITDESIGSTVVLKDIVAAIENLIA